MATEHYITLHYITLHDITCIHTLHYTTLHYMTVHYITFSQALKVRDKQSSAGAPASSFGRGHRHAAYLGPPPDAPARVTALRVHQWHWVALKQSLLPC